MKNHPDRNKHDKDASSRFAEINNAYEILKDPERRKVPLCRFRSLISITNIFFCSFLVEIWRVWSDGVWSKLWRRSRGKGGKSRRPSLVSFTSILSFSLAFPSGPCFARFLSFSSGFRGWLPWWLPWRCWRISWKHGGHSARLWFHLWRRRRWWRPTRKRRRRRWRNGRRRLWRGYGYAKAAFFLLLLRLSTFCLC